MQIQGLEQGTVWVPPNTTVVVPFNPPWTTNGDISLAIVSPVDASWENTVFGWGATSNGRCIGT